MISMTVKSTIRGIENGSKHIMLIDNETGEVFLSTIWHNEIPEQYLDKKVVGSLWKEYELRLFIQ